MKRNVLDKLVGFFAPEVELRRIRARGNAELLLRSYDAAKTYSTDDWTTATKGSANSEISGAQSILRDKGRDAVRNNPYAGRALSAIVSNTVGSGILPNIKGKDKLNTSDLNSAWKEWAESTLCDALGKNNFYALQALVMRSVVESGEVLALKEISADAIQLRILESDFIVNNKVTSDIVQGIKLDGRGRPKSYHIYDTHPSDTLGSLKEREVAVQDLCHVYRMDRPGQLRGVSWFHPVLRQLEDFNQFQQATLVSRKVSACYSAFITSPDSGGTLSASELIAKRETESMLSPGTIRYLDQGESVMLASPPKVDGYDEYCRQTLRGIASGLGITYEALTSDYSQVNFSSGRMGHLEFRKNVEIWRWNMLIPMFCDPSFKLFLKWCEIRKGIDTRNVSVDWCPPAWSMIDPNKEISALTDAMRAGLISYSRAVREQGLDPEELLLEISNDNKRIDELKISFDSDPRKLTKAGLIQADPNKSNSVTSGDSAREQND